MTLPAALLLLLATLTAAAQAPPAPSPTPDTRLESTLAAQFEAARAATHLHPLTRIPDRPALRQLTCSAAQNGITFQNNLLLRVLSLESQAGSTVVRTSDPTHLPPELAAIAAYDDRGADPSHRITRYSIAVFPDPHTPGDYWIGLALYWSRLRQAFALHISHSYAPPDLRPALAPACANVH